jgi:DNA polymerase elongation subunit (family B)
MFASRKAFKNHMLKATQELEEMKHSGADPTSLAEKISEVATYSAKQQAYKISLNSLYGATANAYFRYNSRDISEGITTTGQLIIRYISKRLNVHLNSLFKTQDVDYVIFNDTDSAGLNLEYLVNKMFKDQTDKQKIVNFLDKFVQHHINPYLVQEFQRLADYLNAFENRLSMNREVIADKGLWRGKKNYILQMYDKEGIRYTTPKMKIMGIETAKSSTPNIVRESLEKAIKILLNGTEEELQVFVKKFKEKFFCASVQDIASPRGVSDIDKWVSSNGDMIKGIPIHVRGSVVYNRLLKNIHSGEYAPIKNGDKIKFIYLKVPNSAQSHVIAFLDTLPPAFNLEKLIDRDIQFNRTFLEPLKSLSSIAGMSVEKINSLDSFFE